MSSIEVLGAYGTKAKGKGTTSILLNSNNVVDAGNIVDTLGLKSIELETVWLTHSHLDHIVDIAYMIDNGFSLRDKPLKIKALKETITTLQKNFFNDKIWPDFSKVYLANNKPVLLYEEIECYQEYQLSEQEKIFAFPTDHTVASCGYVYIENESAIVITSDTSSLKSTRTIIDKKQSVKALVVECSFPNNMENLAKESKHLTPKLLFEQLNIFQRDDFRLYINHIKPFYEEEILEEIMQNRGKWQPKIIKDGNFITF